MTMKASAVAHTQTGPEGTAASLPRAGPSPRNLAFNVSKGDTPERGRGEVDKGVPSEGEHDSPPAREETLALRK
jgi:hypothetical protein